MRESHHRDETSPTTTRESTDVAALRSALAAVTSERDASVEAHRRDRERERRLADELQHRLQNTLALIRSIIRRTLEAGGSPEEFAEHFDGRVAAISRYQQMAADGSLCPVEIEDILRDELLATSRLDRPGCTLSGPPVLIEGDALSPVVLAVHELVTNALKFGALTEDCGMLNVKWWLSAPTSAVAAEGSLHLQWLEEGVSVLSAAPRPRGFGQQFLEQGLRYQLGATTSFDLRPGGLACGIELPLRNIRVAADG